MKIIKLTLINSEGYIFLNLENVVSFEVSENQPVECITLNGLTYIVEESIEDIIAAIMGE